jgi:hypothetical protein
MFEPDLLKGLFRNEAAAEENLFCLGHRPRQRNVVNEAIQAYAPYLITSRATNTVVTNAGKTHPTSAAVMQTATKGISASPGC